MNRYALVLNELVVEIALWDSVTPWTPPFGADTVLIPDGSMVDIGWGYVAPSFSAPDGSH